MRLIRLDDYPYGVKTLQDREWVYPRIGGVCRILNRYEIPFILGCVPLYMTPHDAAVLKAILPPHGKAVMHGFSHGFDLPEILWGNIEKTWPLGGEFMGMSEDMIERRYVLSDTILSSGLGDLYDETHFIAPFNVYTHNLVRVLGRHGVRYLHTADEEHSGASWFPTVEGGRIEAVVSEHNKTYDWVDHVVDHFDNPSQITLHWSFDCQAYPDDWWQKYEHFARKLVEHENATGVR